MLTQLVDFLRRKNAPCERQHGFTSGWSTLNNAFTCDKIRADAILEGHAVDLISFDFKSAFDKALHRFVLEALADVAVTGMPLCWFANYLANRTQQVRVGIYLSVTSLVISCIVQGFCLGPELFTVLLDMLLRQVKLLSLAFAHDLKSVDDVVKFTRAGIQADIDLVVRWSEKHLMPLSQEKCGVLLCGRDLPINSYNINDMPQSLYSKHLRLLAS